MTCIPVKCDSPPCRASFINFRKTFYVDSLEAPCPSCSLKGYLSRCEDIHLVVPDKHGHLESKVDGQRYRFLCGRANRLFRLPINTPGFPHHYTSVPSACTCTECLLEYGSQQLNGELLLIR